MIRPADFVTTFADIDPSVVSAYFSDKKRIRFPFIAAGAAVSGTGSLVLGYVRHSPFHRSDESLNASSDRLKATALATQELSSLSSAALQMPQPLSRGVRTMSPDIQLVPLLREFTG